MPMSAVVQLLDEVLHYLQASDPNQHQSTEYIHGFHVAARRLDPIAKVLLCGVYDDNHLFSKLRGMRYLVQRIWEFVVEFNSQYWFDCLEKDGVFSSIVTAYRDDFVFPEPKDLNINMMPFVMHTQFEATKLPQYLREYHALIVYCLNEDETQIGKIGYLTIQETFTAKGKTQRRPGLHVEAPGSNGDGYDSTGGSWLCWGLGEDGPVNGIYIASTVDYSCRFWNVRVADKAIGRLGDVEHLRKVMEYELCYNEIPMWENRLYWITDRTPHESLPVQHDAYRQFFRLVTHPVSVWYEQHSTANPNGVVPNPEITQIIKGNKFSCKNQNYC